MGLQAQAAQTKLNQAELMRQFLGTWKSEMKSLISYHKKNDKLIEADLMKGSDIMVYAFWFKLKNTCIEIPYEYIADPEKASVKWNIEFKSPDSLVQTMAKDNKIVQVMTFKCEKM